MIIQKKNRLLFALVVSLIITSCKPNRISLEYIATYNLEEGLYYEKYGSINGGVFASDTYYYYLTDSIAFRKYIGLCSEGQWIVVRKKNDGIYNTFKYTSSESVKDAKPKLIETKIYSIPALRKERQFE